MPLVANVRAWTVPCASFPSVTGLPSATEVQKAGDSEGTRGTGMKEQRRGRRIAMTEGEVDAYLRAERMCRVGTVGADGAPHVSPLWFVWDGTALWLNSVVKSQRWTNLVRDPRVSVIFDGGHDFGELHGVEITGRAEMVGEVPRTSATDARVAEPERLFGVKYADGAFRPDGNHAWLRIVPDKMVSWDFRKMPGG
jgi:PPOX class probable F420-dependent enzyme